MIQSFKDRRTQQFFEGRLVRAFHGFSDQATRRLTVLDNAASLRDLVRCPATGWRLSPATERASTASESIAGGVYASAGKTKDHTTWKSWTTTDEEFGYECEQRNEAGAPRRDTA